MRKTALLACFVSAFGAAPGWATCTLDLAAEEAKVAAARSCEDAHEIYEACLWGSTADVQRGAMIRELCEKGFLGTLGAVQKKKYNRRIATCEKKYSREDGTMYRSMEAVCAEGTAYDFWKKYRPK